jgi:hypothetical protein
LGALGHEPLKKHENGRQMWLRQGAETFIKKNADMINSVQDLEVFPFFAGFKLTRFTKKPPDVSGKGH